MKKYILSLFLITTLNTFAAEQAPKELFKLPADAIVTRFVPRHIKKIPADHRELKYFAAYAAIHPVEINVYKGLDNRYSCAINHPYEGPLAPRAQCEPIFKMLQSHDPAQIHAALVERFEQQKPQAEREKLPLVELGKVNFSKNIQQ